MSLDLKEIKLSFVSALNDYYGLYEQEDADPEEIAQARLKLIKQAKEALENKKSAEAIQWYGLCLATGEEGFPVNIEKGIKILTEAAMMKNDDARNALGDIFSGNYVYASEELFDIEKAIKFYEKASDNGNGYAAYRLVQILAYDDFGIKDVRRGIDYLERAVHLGYDMASYLEGAFKYEGYLLPMNKEEALSLFKEKVEEVGENTELYDETAAMSFYYYGLANYTGEISEIEGEEALSYIQVAAELNDPQAMEFMNDYNHKYAIKT